MRPKAYIYMSLSLRGVPCAYTRAVDFAVLREVLRLRREHLGWTLDVAETNTGVNRATIHTLENIKRERDYKPEFETIERIAVPMGYSLARLFALIEEIEATKSLQAHPFSDKQVAALITQRVAEASPDVRGSVPASDRTVAELVSFLQTLSQSAAAALVRIEEARRSSAGVGVEAAGGRDGGVAVDGPVSHQQRSVKP